MDREKVIKELEIIIWEVDHNSMWLPGDDAIRDALALLKEQEEREKAICKGICEFIRGSCSTDTYEDKEYVCHVIQQMFIKGSR